MTKFCWVFRDEESDETQAMQAQNKVHESSGLGLNPFLDIPDVSTAIEYKKGYVMRKCCVDPNGKKSKQSGLILI